MTDDAAIQKKQKWKKDGKTMFRKLFILFIVPLILIGTGGWYYFTGGQYISTENAYIKSEATTISAEVSGRVVNVSVKDNELVHKGQELFSIDPEPYEIAVKSAKANLESVRVDIKSIRSNYERSLTKVLIEEENVRHFKDEYDRYQSLIGKSVISQEKLNKIHYDFNVSEKELDAAKSEVEVLRTELGGNIDMPIEMHPKYQMAQAALAQKELDLSRVKVFSSQEGIAANVTLNQSEYVVAGLPVFTLIDKNNVWIEANFKETDLTYMKLGQLADIVVDAYPDEEWKAKILSITPGTGAEFSILPAQNSSGNWVKVVQRVMVKFEFVGGDHKEKLLSGMSTHISVDTGANRLTRMLDK